ncbi:MAG: hypothetical protein Ct9H300mP27_00970 [Chloroflexota bacterium]|nr:MAG: hypothetical protein Ct9H300mP27_00970 [Chloroflexota bacterium]
MDIGVGLDATLGLNFGKQGELSRGNCISRLYQYMDT